MKLNKFWNGTLITFLLILAIPYVSTFFQQDEDGLLITQLKAQEYNYWIDQEVYEGLTYRDIFEGGQLLINGDFINGTTNWFDIGSSITSVSNNILEIDSTNGTGGLGQGGIFNSTDTFFLYGDVKGENSYLSYNNPQFPGGFGSPAESDNYFSPIYYKTQNSNFSSSTYVYLRTFGGYIGYYKNIFVINMSQLNIEEVSLEQIYEWLEYYLRYKDSNQLDYYSVFDNYYELAPDSNPFEIVNTLTWWMDIVDDTYKALQKYWNTINDVLKLLLPDVTFTEASDIVDSWWFEPFRWLIGD